MLSGQYSHPGSPPREWLQKLPTTSKYMKLNVPLLVWERHEMILIGCYSGLAAGAGAGVLRGKTLRQNQRNSRQSSAKSTIRTAPTGRI